MRKLDELAWKKIPSRIGLIPLSLLHLFFYNPSLRHVESYAAEKKWLDLEYCTELLLEMVHFLWYMRAMSPTTGTSSGGEEREQGIGSNTMLRRIAMGLMSSIYLGSDPTDKLGLLWRTWQPATFSKQHLLNLCELGYMTFKVKKGQIEELREY